MNKADRNNPIINRELLIRILSITKEEGGVADPLKENVSFVSIYNRGIEGFSNEEISNHVKLLRDGGLIEARNIPSLDGDQWHPEKILKEGVTVLNKASEL